jgi:hypothetical protein
LARGSDYTIIPGYDEIADTVRHHLPQYIEWETAEIWDVLLSDYTPWPAREKFYADALDDILAAQSEPCVSISCEDF